MATGTLKHIFQTLAIGDGPRGGAAGFLRPINTDLIAEKLGIDRVAAESGRSNFPASEATMLDVVEQKIIQQIEGEWTWHGGELLNHLRAYATRLVEYSIESEFSRLQLKASAALARLRGSHHIAEAELGALRNAYIEARTELVQFREKHRLARPARNPSHRWTTVGLLTVLIGIESILNGLFFAPGSDFGLVGGVVTALGISFVNVTFAFLLGLGPARWMNHRNWIVKLAGFIILVTGGTLLLGLHAFAAHLRDATAVAGEDNAMTRAIETMVRAPWAVDNLSSLYLFGLGTIFGIGALWKGYKFDDPYPGYGAQWRRFETARVSYADEHFELFDDLKTTTDDTIEALDTGISRIPLFPQQAATIRAQRTTLLQTFRGYEEAVERAANELLARFRNGNRAVRTDAPPPYFDRPWKLPYSLLESAEVKSLSADTDHHTPDVNAMLSELRRISEDVLNEYQTLVAKYPHTTQIQ